MNISGRVDVPAFEQRLDEASMSCEAHDSDGAESSDADSRDLLQSRDSLVLNRNHPAWSDLPCITATIQSILHAHGELAEGPDRQNDDVARRGLRRSNSAIFISHYLRPTNSDGPICEFPKSIDIMAIGGEVRDQRRVNTPAHNNSEATARRLPHHIRVLRMRKRRIRLRKGSARNRRNLTAEAHAARALAEMLPSSRGDETLRGINTANSDNPIQLRPYDELRFDPHRHDPATEIVPIPPNLRPVRVTAHDDAQARDPRILPMTPPLSPPSERTGGASLTTDGGGGRTTITQTPGTTGGVGTPSSKPDPVHEHEHEPISNVVTEHTQASYTPRQVQAKKSFWIFASIAVMAAGGLATCIAVAETEATDRAILANAKRAHAFKLLHTINHNGIFGAKTDGMLVAE